MKSPSKFMLIVGNDEPLSTFLKCRCINIIANKQAALRIPGQDARPLDIGGAVENDSKMQTWNHMAGGVRSKQLEFMVCEGA